MSALARLLLRSQANCMDRMERRLGGLGGQVFAPEPAPRLGDDVLVPDFAGSWAERAPQDTSVSGCERFRRDDLAGQEE